MLGNKKGKCPRLTQSCLLFVRRTTTTIKDESSDSRSLPTRARWTCITPLLLIGRSLSYHIQQRYAQSPTLALEMPSSRFCPGSREAVYILLPECHFLPDRFNPNMSLTPKLERTRLLLARYNGSLLRMSLPKRRKMLHVFGLFGRRRMTIARCPFLMAGLEISSVSRLDKECRA